MVRGPSPLPAEPLQSTLPISPSQNLPSSTSSTAPHTVKKDGNKKRSQISDKISDFSSEFSSNLRQHYDAQASAIQVDMSLILQTNPYDGPLPDDEESIVKTVYEDFLGGKSVVDPSAESDFVSTVGKWYQQFIRDVNKKMEERDAGLAMLTKKFEMQQTEFDQQYQFRVRMAEEEYRILGNTIRERLVQQITQKQMRLMREKELLDLNDSASYLLHPNQYSIVHPSSPGGSQNPRKTRHARHRVLDHEDAPTVNDLKRKRKANFDSEGGGGSPKPKLRMPAYLNSPFKEAQKRMAYSQYQSSAYSIDRLFTEKELNMTVNHAAVAATDYLIKLKKQTVDDSTGQANGAGADGRVPVATSQNEPGPDEANQDEPPVETERPQSHNTRGGLRNNMTDVNSLNERQPPFAIPKYIPIVSGAKANGAALSPSALTSAEIEQDFAIMNHLGDSIDDPIMYRLLDAACLPAQVTEYQFRTSGSAAGGAGGGAGGVADSSQKTVDDPASRNSPMPSSLTFMPSSIDLFHPVAGSYPANGPTDVAATAGILTSLSTSREALLSSLAGSVAATSSTRQPSQAANGTGGGANTGGGTNANGAGNGPSAGGTERNGTGGGGSGATGAGGGVSGSADSARGGGSYQSHHSGPNGTTNGTDGAGVTAGTGAGSKRTTSSAPRRTRS